MQPLRYETLENAALAGIVHAIAPGALWRCGGGVTVIALAGDHLDQLQASTMGIEQEGAQGGVSLALTHSVKIEHGIDRALIACDLAGFAPIE